MGEQDTATQQYHRNFYIFSTMRNKPTAWFTIIFASVVTLLFIISSGDPRKKLVHHSKSPVQRNIKSIQSSKPRKRLPDALIMGVKKCGTMTLGKKIF